ncbi:peroxiredoxin [Agrobacterium tumefaciens]|uniref:peroxiredoxin n=1 Tax=Agrobacterium tumefaciens TaxID=358 RepID=UPI00287EC4DA|nr:peroxiredoxin [Agrobacterium tumefaciens]MDS7597302.1 peroxiredoxin [Agrobacterium tumefaciens]
MTDTMIGSLAPDFTLPRNGGGTVTLSDLKGKAVVLYFYPKDDTSGCTAEAIDFSALGAQFEAANTIVIGISPDSVKSHDKFAAKHSLSVMLAADEEKSVLEAYGVWKEKSMYGKKYMGVERTTVLVAPDGTIAEIWNKVKVAGHAEAVLDAAKKL